MRSCLTERVITYAEDFNNINLEDMLKTPGLGKISVGNFLAQVIENDLYSDADTLQRVVVKNGIKLKPDVRGYWH